MITPPSVGGALPGLTLKAWALCSSTGAIIKSYNLNAATHPSAGLYTFTFPSALTTATYLVRATSAYDGGGLGIFGFSAYTKTTAGFSAAAGIGGANSDIPFFMEVYE